MFRGLRARLTALYLFAALTLLALIGGGAYLVVDRYFQTSNDLALQHKMADEIRALNLPVPASLVSADEDWYATRASSAPQPVSATNSGTSSAGLNGNEEPGEHEGSGEKEASGGGSTTKPTTVRTGEGSEGAGHASDDPFDAELAAVFVLLVGPNGQQIPGPGAAPPMDVNSQAVTNALQTGSDWRSVDLGSGYRVRLLTYKVQTNGGPVAIQVGRALGDQDRVLKQLLAGLLVLGGISAVLLAATSWWLAGRSLRPAEDAWARQQSFVANASHELRAPLTLMRASAEVALRSLPAKNKDERELIGDVLHESDHMTRLVEDLLLLSRLDAGRLAVTTEPVPVSTLLEDVQRQVGRLADERGIGLGVKANQEVVKADLTRLRQVLLILTDNALRHTRAGGKIGIEAQQKGKFVQIAVSDTGEGIPPEHLPHLFERFYRGNSTPGKDGADSGSGLGLSIAKGLVEAQHGHISISSQVGQGTTVSLLLPDARG